MRAIASSSPIALPPVLPRLEGGMLDKGIQTRETLGAASLPRTFDRMNGMTLTGPPSYDQYVAGGFVAGKLMDSALSGEFVPRDAFLRTSQPRRGILTMHPVSGGIIDASA